MGHRFRLDVSRWPLSIIYSDVSEGEDGINVPDLMARLDESLARRERFMSIHDMSAMPMVGPKHRSDFVEGVNARADVLSRYMCAHAAIATGPLQRGLVTAVLWFIDLPFPTKVFTDRAAAEAWLLSEYQRDAAE